MEKFYKVRESELLKLLEAWHRCNIHENYWSSYDVARELYLKDWMNENLDAGNVTILDDIAAYDLKSYIEVI